MLIYLTFALALFTSPACGPRVLLALYALNLGAQPWR